MIMKNTSKTLVLWLMVLAGGHAMSQQAITIVGGDMVGADGAVSFSGGEVAVKRSVARAITVVNITEYFTEGVQQAYAGTANDVQSPLPFTVKVYPNPATEWVDVDIDIHNASAQLQYELYDIQGKTLKRGEMNSERTHIDLADLPSGNYMLRLTNPRDKKNGNVYKIIKEQ